MAYLIRSGVWCAVSGLLTCACYTETSGTGADAPQHGSDVSHVTPTRDAGALVPPDRVAPPSAPPIAPPRDASSPAPTDAGAGTPSDADADTDAGGPRPIGSPCSLDEQCADVPLSFGQVSRGLCLTAAEGFTGGACSARCGPPSNECGEGAYCVRGRCQPACDRDADCREEEGYSCQEVFIVSACLPAAQPTSERGAPFGPPPQR